MQILNYVIIIYFVIINILGFAIMGIDKNRAKKNQWRVKEKTLFLIAGIGGSVGSILGIRYFHHKTKHLKFIVGMPFLLFLHICILIYLIKAS